MTTFIESIISSIIGSLIVYAITKKIENVKNSSNRNPMQAGNVGTTSQGITSTHHRCNSSLPSFLENSIKTLLAVACIVFSIFTIVNIAKHNVIQVIMFYAVAMMFCGIGIYLIINHENVILVSIRTLLSVFLDYYIMFDLCTGLDFIWRIIICTIVYIICFIVFDYYFFIDSELYTDLTKHFFLLACSIFLILSIVSITEHISIELVAFYAIATIICICGTFTVFIGNDSSDSFIAIIISLLCITLDYFIVFDFNTGLELIWRIALSVILIITGFAIAQMQYPGSLITKAIKIILSMGTIISIIFLINSIAQSSALINIIFFAISTLFCAFGTVQVFTANEAFPVILRTIIWLILDYFAIFDLYTGLGWELRAAISAISVIISYIVFSHFI